MCDPADCGCDQCRWKRHGNVASAPGSVKKWISQLRTEARLAHIAEITAPSLNEDPRAIFRARLAIWDAEDATIDQLIDAALAGDLLQVELLAHKAGLALQTARPADTWLHRSRQIQARWDIDDIQWNRLIDEGLAMKPDFETSLRTLANLVANGEMAPQEARKKLRTIALQERGAEPPQAGNIDNASQETPAAGGRGT